jgi:hypothetical protein
MKHAWRKWRVLIEQADAQRRWDRAYQMLLTWTAASGTYKADHQPILQPFQEDNDERERICARLDPASGPSTND